MASLLAGSALSRAILFYYLAATGTDADRDGHDDRRDALPDEPESVRPSLLARSRAGLSRAVRRERHSLTSYPCRLPDGTIGRTAIYLVDGEWTAVCAVA